MEITKGRAIENDERTYRQQVFKELLQRRNTSLGFVGSNEQIPKASVRDVNDIGVVVVAQLREGFASGVVKEFSLGTINCEMINGGTLRKHVWYKVQNLGNQTAMRQAEQKRAREKNRPENAKRSG
jgi:hypothetical protein